ncbi:MAG TPA: methyltransferase, partial [Chloroflexota bacterium]|nr:methyltransferase [Chloroflexota bacterium]
MLPLQTATPATTELRLRPAERSLIRLAFDLGAATCGGPLSETEDQARRQVGDLPRNSDAKLREAAEAIWRGDDPLGAAYCAARPAAERRVVGSFYTPPELVNPMVSWILGHAPARVVDAGCGSGRYAAEVARRRPDLEIVAVDLDPIATLLTRATLAVLGAPSARVVQADYTALDLLGIAGRTAFVGNPPYVRHHDLTPAAKSWANKLAQQLGLRLSGLAGLHVHFFLATALYARPGDVGCFVTSAEWLDVNYGSALRNVLLGYLGCRAIDLVDHAAVPFADAMTTAVMTSFEVGSSPETVRLRLLAKPFEETRLGEGREVSADLLRQAYRWSRNVAERNDGHDADTISLGDVARVHRGIVTGANSFFLLTREQAAILGLEEWCRPAITSAEEVL